MTNVRKGWEAVQAPVRVDAGRRAFVPPMAIDTPLVECGGAGVPRREARRPTAAD